MKPTITQEDLLKEFNRVILPSDEVVVIYSGIWSFGSMLGKPIRDVPEYLINTICESVGSARTILFPTYTYGYTKTRIFDVYETKPETGALPCHAVARQDFVRTLCPLNSYAVKGPRTEEILAIQGKSLWSDDSVMGWFDQVNARICVLGEPWHEACTHFHRIEEILKVPYRYYKYFPGKILAHSKFIKDANPKMYLRPLGVEMMRDYTSVEPIMRKHKSILESSNPLIPLQSAKAQDIVKACRELFKKNIFGYIRNPDEISHWMTHRKAQEMIEQGACFGED